MMLVALFSVTAFAQKGLKLQPFQMQHSLKVQAVDRKAQPVTNTVNRRAGGELVTPPSTATVETWYTTGGTFYAYGQDDWENATSDMPTVNVAFDGDDIYIQGMAYWFKDAWIKGSISENTATFASGQYIGTDEYGDEFIVGSADGQTISDIVFAYDATEGVLTASTSYILESTAADALSPVCYWYSPTFSKEEPAAPEVVVVPEGLVAEEYAISARNYKDDADVTGSVFIGFDGNDVYIQGLSTMLPEAWVKGTLEGTTITFAKGQYFGNYADMYDVYLNVLVGADVVFDYDATAGTLTAQNQFFLVDNSEYYFDSYRGAVIKKVIEKAAMPANPEISALTNGNYGYYITFNVPSVDVDGDGLAASKLYYMIYTDTEGEIAPLTFTPATHSRLTEDMTEIPYGFTENWDFYKESIYLNDLYSADWNKIGIQSIYYGGGEKNETEVQWFDIKPYAKPDEPVTTSTTFDFNAMDVATSSSESTAGDITEALEMTQDDVTLIISPKEESATTPNRFWGTRNGAQLRMYSGTLTFTVPEGKQITGIVFNYAKWNEGNGADSGELTNDADAKAATWKGEAQTVIVSIAANTQVNSIEVTVAGGSKPEEGYLFSFEDGTMEGWTTIDADGDGYTWMIGEVPSINTHNDGQFSVYSQSYASSALTPDNYLVSPQMKLDGSITFYACAQDGSWPSEHFGVSVSTNGNTDAADFETIQEWTMTAARVDDLPADAPRKFRANRRVPGEWYQYTVDLSSYAGADGYVAIRHFDCTDMFYLVVDDITLASSHIYLPDYAISPAEGLVEQIESFTLKFNNYDIDASTATATLTNTTTSSVQNGTINAEGNTLTIAFVPTTEAGDYILAFNCKQTSGEDIALNFNYTIEPKEVVVLPAGLEEQAETWYFSATDNNGSPFKGVEVKVVTDGTDMYIQGINKDYLPEAWVKGTIEGTTATFPTGQYFGAFEYEGEPYDMYFVGYGDDIEDVVFDYDAENGVLTATDQYIVINGKRNEVSYYDYFVDAVISKTAPAEPVEVPEGLETEGYAFKAMVSLDEYGAELEEPEAYSYQMQVGFDGNDAYFKGLSDNTADMWLKATKNEEGKYVIPANQYMGQLDVWGMYFFDYYFTAVDAEDNMVDIVLNYDAETNTFTTDQTLVLHDGANVLGEPYQIFNEVVIQKVADVAAVPANPSIDELATVGKTYPAAYFIIPTVDVDGNDLLTTKLYYTVWVEKDGDVVEPFEVVAGEYKNVTENMTEIPYSFEDNWDIFKGGNPFYFNPTTSVESFKKIGIQSIYYGGGECNKSEIVWEENGAYTGISSILTDTKAGKAVIYNLNGQRVENAQKGLYIINGKKVVVK